MAFSKNPALSTYETKRINLHRELNSRGASVLKDEDFLNVFFEVVKNKQAQDSRHFVVKRPGIKLEIPGSAGLVRGSFYWKDFNQILFVKGQDLHIQSVGSSSSSVSGGVFTAGTGNIGFTEYLYPNGTQVVIATDGTKMIQINSLGTITGQVTDADMPVHLPYVVSLDGYIFVVKAGTGDIYNSDLDNPLSWTAGDFISAEMRADKLVTLGRAANYLVAFGTDSIEYFWDAANASGSPLQRTETPFKSHGYIAGKVEMGNAVYFIGRELSTQPSIYKLEDSKIKEIATDVVKRYLASIDSGPFADWHMSAISVVGHEFLMVNAGALTYVYDLENDFWYRWAFDGQANLPILAVHNVTSGSYYSCLFFLDNNTSNLYKFDPTVYQDLGANFTCRIVTEASDFDSMNRKTMHRLSVIGDRPPTDASIQILWSDDDYQSYQGPLNTNLRQDLPSVYRLGWFRQRAFQLLFTENAPMRLMGLEADINMGQS